MENVVVGNEGSEIAPLSNCSCLCTCGCLIISGNLIQTKQNNKYDALYIPM